MPFFGVALLVDGGDSIAWRVTAFVIFVVAMITDKIDGDIARSRGLVTDFGKIADPIADKAMTGMAFVGLAIIFESPWFWAVTILVLVREWSVTLLRLFVLKKVVIAADIAREAEDHLPGDRAQRPGAAAAATRTCRTGWRPRARSSSTWPWPSWRSPSCSPWSPAPSSSLGSGSSGTTSPAPLRVGPPSHFGPPFS